MLFVLFIVGFMMIFYGSGCACTAATNAFNPDRSRVDVLKAVEKISKAVPLVAFGTAFVTASIVLIFK